MQVLHPSAKMVRSTGDFLELHLLFQDWLMFNFSHICAVSLLSCPKPRTLKLEMEQPLWWWLLEHCWILATDCYREVQTKVLWMQYFVQLQFSKLNKCTNWKFFDCCAEQASTRPSSPSPFRRQWIKAWRCWRPWANQYSWVTVKRCSTAPPRLCAPKWCRSIPVCWHQWVWMRSCGLLTRPPPPASTSTTLKSSRSLGE